MAEPIIRNSICKKEHNTWPGRPLEFQSDKITIESKLKSERCKVEDAKANEGGYVVDDLGRKKGTKKRGIKLNSGTATTLGFTVGHMPAVALLLWYVEPVLVFVEPLFEACFDRWSLGPLIWSTFVGIILGNTRFCDRTIAFLHLTRNNKTTYIN